MKVTQQNFKCKSALKTLVTKPGSHDNLIQTRIRILIFSTNKIKILALSRINEIRY